MPEFIIIGAQKCGTSSLYNYLTQHPRVSRATKKELHFFDNKFQMGLNWYIKQFSAAGSDCLTGESSSYYIFHPHAPRRISELFPSIKLIVLLRNPVDRAYSSYWHYVRRGFETLTFEDAIANEENRLRGEVDRIMRDESYRSYIHQRYSYLSRGRYLEQLKLWFSFFSRHQILILRSEEFYEETSKVLDRVMEFLELPSFHLDDYLVHNQGNYPEMMQTTRRQLSAYFEPYNRSLYDYLGGSLHATGGR